MSRRRYDEADSFKCQSSEQMNKIEVPNVYNVCNSISSAADNSLASGAVDFRVTDWILRSVLLQE